MRQAQTRRNGWRWLALAVGTLSALSRAGQRHVDQEDRGPAEQLGERAAERRTEGQAERRGDAPDRQGTIARRALGEVIADQRQGRREQQRTTQALHGAGEDQRQLALGQAAREGGEGVQALSEDVHAAPAEQVGGAPAEQEEAAEGHRIGAHHPLQALRREIQRPADFRQGDEHDGGVEGDDQLRAGEQGEHPVGRGGTVRHGGTPGLGWARPVFLMLES